jgi:hypothetical protein
MHLDFVPRRGDGSIVVTDGNKNSGITDHGPIGLHVTKEAPPSMNGYPSMR